MSITVKEIKSFMSTAGIPPEYHSGSFKSMDTKYIKPHLLKLAVEWANDGKWIVFMGSDPGVGKTALASYCLTTAYVNNFYKNDMGNMQRYRMDRYKFLDASDLAIELGQAGVNYKRDIEEITNLKAIVIDELGAESEIHKSGKALVRNLIWRMHRKNKQVIITTPIKSTEAFEAEYGGGLVSRIQQRGEFMLLCGEDYRLKE